MNIYIRVDASIEIGTGHVMRCLVLAEKLQEKGANIRFICRKHKGHLIGLITTKGFKVLVLEPPRKLDAALNDNGYIKWLGVPLSVDAYQTKELLMNDSVDLLIIDHYAIDKDWEVILKDQAKKIMVIDDLANRKHECDFLLDQNFIADYQNRYDFLVPSDCKTFLGPSYVLLRPEFYLPFRKLKLRTGAVKRILIFFGGIDHSNVTGIALSSFLATGHSDIEVDVVVGHSNLYKNEIASVCNMYENLHFYCQIDNMAELMNLADLAVGAGGTTTWERCFLGLPSIVISIAENQEEICKSLAKEKVITYLGKKETVDQSCLTRHLQRVIENEAGRTEMSRLSLKLMKDSAISQQMMLKEIMK